MTRPAPEAERRREASEHLLYEMDMLEGTARQLACGVDLEGQDAVIRRNALLESFAIHARTLIGFFGVGPSWNGDVLAEHYVPTEVARALTHRLSQDARVAHVRDRVNKDVAHLTYDRATRGPEARTWDLAAVVQTFREVMSAFAREVQPEHVDAEFWRAWAQPSRTPPKPDRQTDVPLASPWPVGIVPVTTLANTISVRIAPQRGARTTQEDAIVPRDGRSRSREGGDGGASG